MVDEFDLPMDIIDRKVTKMKMISPSNREVDVGKTLSETEYIGMCRREVLDDYLRTRAKQHGAKVVNGLFMRMEQVRLPAPAPFLSPEHGHRPRLRRVARLGAPAVPLPTAQLPGPPAIAPACTCSVCRLRRAQARANLCPPPDSARCGRQPEADGPYTIHFNSYEDGGKVGKPESLQVDAVIGADGANSRVAKEIDAGEYDYAIAFQERIRIPEDKMEYYKDLAEMYVGDDVSPDFYGWVFPKYDHVAVGARPPSCQRCVRGARAPGLHCRADGWFALSLLSCHRCRHRDRHQQDRHQAVPAGHARPLKGAPRSAWSLAAGVPGLGPLVCSNPGCMHQVCTDGLQVKTEGGKIIRVEAHPIPEHPRPRRCKGRVTLVGDAAGYVTKCSGEGIYFAAKSGRMAAEAIAEGSQKGAPCALPCTGCRRCAGFLAQSARGWPRPSAGASAAQARAWSAS